MKIFNSEGKLFNVINIIDLIIILVVGAIIVVGAFKLNDNSPINPSSDGYRSEITVTLRYTTSDEGELNALKKGDQLVADNRLQQIFIEDIVINPEKVAVLNGDKLIESEHPFNKDMYITIRGEAYIDSANIHIANQNIRIGNDFFLKTLSTEFKSTVSNIEM